MNSEITPVLEKIKGTEEYDILVETESAYRRIEALQQAWYKKSKFTCPEGCGRCCEHFEPDLLENEALYMAAWLIANKPEIAQQVSEGKFPRYGTPDHKPNKNVSRETQPRASSEKMLAFFHLTPEGCRTAAAGDSPNERSECCEQRESPLSHCRGPGVGPEGANTASSTDNMLAFFHLTPDGCRPAAEGDSPNERSEGRTQRESSLSDGCLFFDPDSPYHCTIYNGRASICRLFGASGSRDKFGNEVWKPCKFYPAELLEKHNPPLAHQQYSVEEIKRVFGTFPPVMSDLMEQEETFTPDDDQTRLIRDTLPERIRHLMWIIELSSGKDIH